jgi:hypothetical protein
VAVALAPPSPVLPAPRSPPLARTIYAPTNHKRRFLLVSPRFAADHAMSSPWPWPTQPVQGQLACDVCPSGKYSRKEGSSICERCMPGQYSHSSAYRCKSCPSGYYQQSDSGNEDGLTSTCQHCPWGKFQNLNGSVYCEGVWSNHLLVMVPTNDFEQRQCPRIGVSCENNSKRYTG